MRRLLSDVLTEVLADFEPAEEGVLIGYARVSTRDQNLDLQKDAFKRAGISEDNIYEDQCSAVAKRRPGLERAMENLRRGDVLVVWRLDRFARSLSDLLRRMDELHVRGIGFKSLTEAIDTTTASGRLIMHVMGAIAEFERQLIADRAKAGMRAAKERGKHIGRPMKIDLKKARELLKQGMRVEEVAMKLGVSEATIYAHFPVNVLVRWRRMSGKYARVDEPPQLRWQRGAPPDAWISTDRPRAELAALGIDQLSKREAKATPIEFRDLLLAIARSAVR